MALNNDKIFSMENDFNGNSNKKYDNKFLSELYKDYKIYNEGIASLKKFNLKKEFKSIIKEIKLNKKLSFKSVFDNAFITQSDITNVLIDTVTESYNEYMKDKDSNLYLVYSLFSKTLLTINTTNESEFKKIGNELSNTSFYKALKPLHLDLYYVQGDDKIYCYLRLNYYLKYSFENIPKWCPNWNKNKENK